MSETSSQSASPKRSAHDAAAHVTSEIARLLEQGVLPWRAPWDPTRAAAATPGLPLRANGEPYRGANVMLLWAAQIARGYAKRSWLTYRQAESLGAYVRKGEKAAPVIYYGQAKSRGDEQNQPEGEDASTYRFLKLFYVFNAEQLDDLPEGYGAELSPPALEPPALFHWVERAGAQIRIGGTTAHYAPSDDMIHMPPIQAFTSAEHFAATLAHETIHWTGASSRLDTLKDYFTDRAARAREELRAELGAAIIGALAGLAPFHLEDHAAYVADWLKLLRADPRAFLSAAAKAQAAVDWLIERAGPPAAAETANPSFSSDRQANAAR